MVTAEMVVLAVDIDGVTTYMDALAFEELDEETRNKVRSRKTVVAEGELLTMDDVEALELGFSSMSVSGLDDMLKKFYKCLSYHTGWFLYVLVI